MVMEGKGMVMVMEGKWQYILMLGGAWSWRQGCLHQNPESQRDPSKSLHCSQHGVHIKDSDGFRAWCSLKVSSPSL